MNRTNFRDKIYIIKKVFYRNREEEMKRGSSTRIQQPQRSKCMAVHVCSKHLVTHAVKKAVIPHQTVDSVEKVDTDKFALEKQPYL